MIFIDNKYTKTYYAIIHRAKDRTIEGYSENHHIVPKSIGGGNSKDNMAKLTAREHYICHWLLTKMTEGINKSKMWCALRCFNIKSKKQDRKKMNAKLYEKASIEHAAYVSKLFKGRKGTPRTDEQKRRSSEAQKGKPGRPHSEIAKEKIRQASMGNANAKGKKHKKPRSDEHKEKLRKIATGKKFKRIRCPHCNTEMAVNTIYVHHFDNCRTITER